MEGLWTRIALRLWVALILLFLFTPIALIFVYAFNTSNIQSWPIPGFTLKWFTSTWNDPDVRRSLALSLQVGLGATALSFDEVIVTTFTAGAQNTLPLWIFGAIRLGQRLPEVNVVVSFVILVTIIPVVIAARLTGGGGTARVPAAR